jgi:hypothetical protein
LKNRRPVGEEYVKKAAKHRAAARLARVVPYDLDKNEKLDPMALLEEVTQHFYRKAKIEESLGRFCDFRIVDNALQKCGPDCARDCEFPASEDQCRKAGCCGSECRFIAWRHDGG